MRATRITPIAMLIFASGLALHSASAQGVKRTELQRHDLSVPGREVIQVRVDLDPGSDVPSALASRRRDHRPKQGSKTEAIKAVSAYSTSRAIFPSRIKITQQYSFS
jgi:hypothetical protein